MIYWKTKNIVVYFKCVNFQKINGGVMKLTFFKILIIICIIVLSFLFYKNLNEVKGKIANQDIVLDLVASHDGYHELYMKQFEGIQSRENTIKIIKEVYLKNSNKIVKPQIQIGDKVVRSEEELSDEELNKFDNYEFSYNSEFDVLKITGLEELEDDTNE